MFNENKKTKEVVESGGKHPSRVSLGTSVRGDISSESDFRIDGKLEGNIKTSGKVVVGKDGSVEGTIRCSQADIEGKVKGELIVGGLLSLKSTAMLEGKVTTSKLAVEPGATFEASCQMKKGLSDEHIVREEQIRKA